MLHCGLRESRFLYLSCKGIFLLQLRGN